MTDERNDTGLGPFGRAARLYRAAGWPGTLPVGRSPGQKSPPPGGWTGHGSPYPSDADVGTWEAGAEAAYNIGLRMPPGVIGLDVDAGYVKDGHAKEGDKTLAALEQRLGPLPPTWVSSARPAPSGIRFFRVPAELDGREINWPGEAGPFIEIIQPGHRYAVVWPSTNPDAGGAPYRWGAPHPDGYLADPDHLVRPEDLAALPETWIRGLALPYDRTEKADVGVAGMADWWDALRDGEMCPLIHSVWTKAVHDLASASSARHETARDALSAIVRAGGEGHRGVPQAVASLGAAFERAVGADRARGGEWQRLVSGAVKLAAADNPRPQRMCPHDIPAGTGLVVPAGFTSPGAVSTTTASPSAAEIIAPGALTLPDTFWRARESLARIRQAAHSRVRSADVVLAGLLCRLAASVPHTLRADTGIGQPASLNLFAAVVGPSGGGKSSGLSVSRELLKAGRYLEEFPLGSGEGIAEAYMGETDEPTGEMAKDGSAKVKRVRKQVRHAALFHSDEGGSLNKLIERAGSTVGETLRTAWSGETLGQKNGRAETTRTVPARSYAAGLMIGYQPTTVLPLLADVEAGTPQRFLYVWAVDASIPPRSARVPWPGEIMSPFPAEVPTDLPPPGALLAGPPAVDLSPITFAEEILDELYDTEHAKNTGSLPAGHWLMDETGALDPFKSQHTVMKVKVSALFALLESRRRVTAEDWAVAQVYLDTSDTVRRYLQALARDAAGKARAAQMAAEAEAEHYRAHARASVAAALDLTAERRLAVRVALWVHEGGEALTVGAIRKRAASRDRGMVEAAIEIGRESGWLTAGDDGRWYAGASRPVGD